MQLQNSLSDNIKKLARVSEAVNGLSNLDIYYVSSYPPQAKCDLANKKLLRNALRSMRRLTKVIEKQATQEIHKVFPHYHYYI